MNTVQQAYVLSKKQLQAIIKDAMLYGELKYKLEAGLISESEVALVNKYKHIDSF